MALARLTGLCRSGLALPQLGETRKPAQTFPAVCALQPFPGNRPVAPQPPGWRPRLRSLPGLPPWRALRSFLPCPQGSRLTLFSKPNASRQMGLLESPPSRHDWQPSREPGLEPAVQGITAPCPVEKAPAPNLPLLPSPFFQSPPW